MSKMGQLTYFSHSYKFIQRQICLPIDVSEFGFAWLVHVFFYLFIWLLTPPYLVQSAGATKISVVLVATGTGEVIQDKKVNNIATGVTGRTGSYH